MFFIVLCRLTSSLFQLQNATGALFPSLLFLSFPFLSFPKVHLLSFKLCASFVLDSLGRFVRMRNDSAGLLVDVFCHNPLLASSCIFSLRVFLGCPMLLAYIGRVLLFEFYAAG